MFQIAYMFVIGCRYGHSDLVLRKMHVLGRFELINRIWFSGRPILPKKHGITHLREKDYTKFKILLLSAKMHPKVDSDLYQIITIWSSSHQDIHLAIYSHSNSVHIRIQNRLLVCDYVTHHTLHCLWGMGFTFQLIAGWFTTIVRTRRNMWHLGLIDEWNWNWIEN